MKIACDAARETGKNVCGIFLKTMLHPAKEAEEAQKLAREMGAFFRILEIDELEGAGIADNPLDRCYRCKRYLFKKSKKRRKDQESPGFWKGPTKMIFTYTVPESRRSVNWES